MSMFHLDFSQVLTGHVRLYQVRLKYVTSSVMAPVLGCSAIDNTPPKLTFMYVTSFECL